MYRGMLAIPYLRYTPWDDRWSTASIRFRRLDGGTPKYQTIAGDAPRLYNTVALTRHHPKIAITEGEIDAISADLSGIPAVGVPGALMWKPFMRELFVGYREVYILADGDDAGLEFAHRVASTLPNSKTIPMPHGEDVNSVVNQPGGVQLLHERING